MGRRSPEWAWESPLFAWDSKDVAQLSYPLPLLQTHLQLRQDQGSDDTATSLWPAAQIAVAVLQAVHDPHSVFMRWAASAPVSSPTLAPAPAERSRLDLKSNAQTKRIAAQPVLPPHTVLDVLRSFAGLQISKQDFKEEKRRPQVWELGSGLALGGMTSSLLGWDVVTSDTEASLAMVTKPCLEHNSNLIHYLSKTSSTETRDPKDRRGVVQAVAFDWFASPEHKSQQISRVLGTPDARIDLVLTTDTAYEITLVPGLLRSIHQLCTPYYTTIFFAMEKRDPIVVQRTLDMARDEYNLRLTLLAPAQVRATVSQFANPTWTADDVDDFEVLFGYAE